MSQSLPLLSSSSTLSSLALFIVGLECQAFAKTFSHNGMQWVILLPSLLYMIKLRDRESTQCAQVTGLVGKGIKSPCRCLFQEDEGSLKPSGTLSVLLDMGMRLKKGKDKTEHGL